MFIANRSFPPNLNLWHLEMSEMINLQMLTQKNTFNVLSLSSPFEKNVLSNVCLGFFGSDTILAHAKDWDRVLWNCSRCSTTLRSASTFYTFTKRLTGLKLLKCALIDTQLRMPLIHTIWQFLWYILAQCTTIWQIYKKITLQSTESFIGVLSLSICI